MKIESAVLQDLMKTVDRKVDELLTTLITQQNEINNLQNENKQLKDSYSEILKQINSYVDELKEIKHLNTQK